MFSGCKNQGKKHDLVWAEGGGGEASQVTHLKGASATAFVNAQAKSASSFQLCTIRTWASVCSCRSTKA